MSISVIIPVKNRADLLPSTLDNILNQRIKPSEIIVVDDHSTDNLSALKNRYKDTVIFMDSNGHGPGAARNTGFLASTGNQIQFFDSDDLMTSDKLEIQSDILNTTSAGMVYSPHVKALEYKKGHWKQMDVILYYKPLSKKRRYDQWLIRGACMVTQSCLFTKELIKDAGLWRTDLMTHEDLEFLFRIGREEPYPEHSSIPAVIYRQHGLQITDGSTTTNSRAIDQLNAYDIINQYVTSDQYTFADKKVMADNIIRASSFVEPDLWPVDIDAITHSFMNKGAYQLGRITKKIQRTITKSEWIFLHGINSNPTDFEKYIQKLS